MWLFPAAAAVVSTLFFLALGRQWLQRRTPQLLAWSLALAMFAVASGAAATGMVAGWSEATFRLYYLLGAIANVPVLGVGTLYVLGLRRAGGLAAFTVAVGIAAAAVVVAQAELNEAALRVAGIPSGGAVVPDLVRAVSRYASYAGTIVVVGGALWSAARLRRADDARLRDVAAGNVLIAAGTIVVAIGSAFARYGRGAVLALSLAIGVTIMFAGFMRTRGRRVGA